METNDLISRTAAIKWFFRPYSNEEYYSNLDVERALKAIPVVNAAPVIHGRWNEIDEGDGDYTYDCSVCGGKLWVAADTTPEENGMKYCPYCGAKMDSERRNNN